MLSPSILTSAPARGAMRAALCFIGCSFRNLASFGSDDLHHTMTRSAAWDWSPLHPVVTHARCGAYHQHWIRCLALQAMPCSATPAALVIEMIKHGIIDRSAGG